MGPFFCSVAARVHGGLRVQRNLGAAQLQHLQLGTLVHDEEDIVPRPESSRSAEEGANQRSQPGQTVGLCPGADAGGSGRSSGVPAEADDGDPAQRASSTSSQSH